MQKLSPEASLANEEEPNKGFSSILIGLSICMQQPEKTL